MNARELSDLDPDLIDHRLDLGRSELQPILDRYVPRRALIVGSRDATSGVGEGLIAEGWQIASCEGPGRTRCPLMEGKHCYVRESADVAVVYIDGKKTWPASGLLPRIRCAADPASPAVVVLEWRVDPPKATARTRIIGALQGSRGIMHAVRDVVGLDPHSPGPTKVESN